MVSKKRKRPTKSKALKNKGAIPASKPSVIKDIIDSPPSMERIKEKDAGFGVLKGVAGVIIVLIVGATFLANYSGTDKTHRGEGEQGDACEKSDDCLSGHICYQYRDNPFECMELCKTDDDCADGFSCTSVSRTNKRRVKVKNVCTEQQKTE